MRNWSSWLTVVCFFLVLALPVGVHVTASALEDRSGDRLAVGLVLLVSGIVGLESVSWLLPAGSVRSDSQTRPLFGPDLLIAAFLQAITVLMYGVVLDGHVRLRACGWVYLAYAAWALAVTAWQRGRLSGWGRMYVRSGWAVAIAFGLPLTLPTLKAVGLVPFGPL
jgi:hypothetical protein